MFSIIHQSKGPKVLLITPLLPTHKVSRDTRIGILRNDINFDWVSWSNVASPHANVRDGLAEYRRRYKNVPKYVMVIDNDIAPSRNLLLNMYDTITRTKEEIAYCYCNFKFKGAVNQAFENIEFNALRLLQSNYVSFNSMVKLEALDAVGGYVVDDEIKRLADWALWLKFLRSSMYGILCKNASFVAHASKSSISAGGQVEYQQQYKKIKDKYIEPMLEGLVY